MNFKRFLQIFMLFVLPYASLTAQSFSNGMQRWTVKLVVLGPGPEIYTWWGHTGLIIEDRLQESSLFYDFGNFSFEEENFYRNFLMGRLIYQAMGFPSSIYLNYASTLGRQLDVYTLNISQDKARELNRLLKEQVKPENSHYLYHHFQDNCATRIRDYLDLALDGKLKEYSSQFPAGTFRSQFRRYSHFMFPVDFMLNYLQGRFVDQPITFWDAQFLPDELGRMLQGLNEETPVILEHQVLSVADPVYDRVPATPPPIWIKSLLWGLGCTLILMLMVFQSYRKKNTFWFYTAWTLELLSTGILGTVLFLMTRYTDHTVTYHNLNLLYTSPVSLVLLFILHSRRRGVQRFFRAIWTLLTLMLVFVIFRDLFSSTGHQNGGIAVFFLPSYVYMAILLYRERPQTLASDLPRVKVDDTAVDDTAVDDTLAD